MAMKTTWIGLGVMGFPMAGHLAAKADVAMTVYNRSPEKAAKWVSGHKGKQAATPKEASAGADFVFACVGNDNDLREIAIGPNGAFQNMKPGAISVDHTTASAEVASQLSAEAKRRGLGCLGAPVPGGSSGRVYGTPTGMCAGAVGDYAEA